jgi:uncharacterized damage-inducible protein DinB
MTLDEIRRLFHYTDWANHLALDASEKLSADQLQHDFKSSHGSIHGTLFHMAAAEWIWLERWNGVNPTNFWSPAEYQQLAAIRNRWSGIEADRRAYLDALREEDLSRNLTFRRLNGEENTMPLIEQMQHIVNHSTLHRGQVVGMLRQLGVEPPPTDLLNFFRL